MPILEKKFDSKGNEIGVQFNPTSSMLMFAVNRSATKNIHKTNEELLKELGLSEKIIDTWQNKYSPHFDEWLAEALETFSQPIKESLYALGYKMAMQGDYNFWKDLAKTHGVVKPEQVDVNILPGRVKSLDAMTPEELQEYQQKLLGDGTSDEVQHSSPNQAEVVK